MVTDEELTHQRNALDALIGRTSALSDDLVNFEGERLIAAPGFQELVFAKRSVEEAWLWLRRVRELMGNG